MLEPVKEKKGIGSKLLEHLCTNATTPILIGTWASATWAIEFYQKHGFQLLPEEEKNNLLHKYWSVPVRQIETSVGASKFKLESFSLAYTSLPLNGNNCSS
jgi:N-acetylglutamate synthase-like GNAT family acetyltransferase